MNRGAAKPPWLPLSGELAKIFDFCLRGSFSPPVSLFG